MKKLMYLLLISCEAQEEKDKNTQDTEETGDISTPVDDAWMLSSHPCVGNRTNTLWCDDASTCFVGCGSTADGEGMYMTTDGGVTWNEPSTTPNGFFETMRVNSISRSSDGLLYIGGIGLNNARVVSMTADGDLEYVHESAGQTWNSFQVGTFRRTSNGSAVSEYLPDNSTWIRDVCILDSDSMVAVVEDSRTSDGYIIQINTDGTWKDLTNYEGGSSTFPVLSRCMVTDEKLFIAGSGGWFSSYPL
jgi:photosystem II stability/assembly factor-like uncharacterized protein